MTDRLAHSVFHSQAELQTVINDEMTRLGATTFPVAGANDLPLTRCVEALLSSGAITVVVQRRINDPDFAAEYGVYYSRQFADVPRTCTRLHFFTHESPIGLSTLGFVDSVSANSYLGFITLRPIARAPVGASILSKLVCDGFVCSTDTFPVHLAGRDFSIEGTPFMQQDNAVAVCAQASIWMALRTMRKREGDRAYDPAQITDAATRYFVNGRTRPNKGGLTIEQMAEAVRAAGYSPHAIPLAGNSNGGPTALTAAEMLDARRKLHAYIESEIPVLLALYPATGGHAVAAIGHSWNPNPAQFEYSAFQKNGASVLVKNAVSWVPEYIVHNDNSGPYQRLPSAPTNASTYSLSCAAIAVPMLPADVFMTGEEAFICGMSVLLDIFESLKKQKPAAVVDAIAQTLVVRLMLAEKRKIRQWAASTAMVDEMKTWLRTGDLPKRVWVFEVHTEIGYGNHNTGPQPTLVGLVLIDPTADALDANIIMCHFNLPAIASSPDGVMLTYGKQLTLVQTKDQGPIVPLHRG